MKNEPSFDHRPDPELGAALRAALEPKDDHAAFAARVMAQYERALGRASVATLDVLASWFRPGIAAAGACLVRYRDGAARRPRPRRVGDVAGSTGRQRRVFVIGRPTLRKRKRNHAE